LKVLDTPSEEQRFVKNFLFYFLHRTVYSHWMTLTLNVLAIGKRFEVIKVRRTLLTKRTPHSVSPCCLHMAVPYTKLPSEQQLYIQTNQQHTGRRATGRRAFDRIKYCHYSDTTVILHKHHNASRPHPQPLPTALLRVLQIGCSCYRQY